MAVPSRDPLKNPGVPKRRQSRSHLPPGLQPLRLLEQADRARAPGEVGALLRQEGLYSSHLSVWRKQREAGELTASAPKKRGPKAKVPDTRDREIEQLQRKLATSEARLKRAEALLDLQKKVSELLGVELPKPPPGEER